MHLKLLVLVFCAVIGKSVGFHCYACSFNSVDTDQSCLTITNSTHTVECPHTYCTILRQEFTDPSGVVASFVRGCEEEPDFLNHEVIDPNFRTFYRACTSNLCNTGNGIESVGGNLLSPTPLFEGQNLLVPGTGGAASIYRQTFHIIVTSFIVTFIMVL